MTQPMAMVGRKNPTLLSPADEVLEITPATVELSERMLATVRRLNGAALAAPQVGVSQRLAVTKSGVTLINFIVQTDGRMITDVEGCLSIPGRWYEVERAERCTVIGIDLDGKIVETEATGFDARMWQHEYDHMLGLILFGRFPEVRR